MQMFKHFAIKGLTLLISESYKAKTCFYEEFWDLQIIESGSWTPEKHYY